MSLDHILLGLLREPQSGYELKNTFDTVFSHFWAAEISQIYRQLKTLERRGLLVSWGEPSDKGPPRKLYETTAEGRSELRDWLAGGPLFADRRVPYLAQTLFLEQLKSREESVRFFEQLREEIEIRLKVLLEIDAAVLLEQEEIEVLEDTDFYGQLVLNHGIHRWRALLAWVEESLAILRNDSPSSEMLHQAGDLARHGAPDSALSEGQPS